MLGLMLFSLILLSNLGVDGAPAPAVDPPPPTAALQSLRELYIAAVEDLAAVDSALAELESLRQTDLVRTGEVNPSTLTAYEGALVSLRAKHGSWPPSRLLHLREGLELLDAAVRADPTNAEARYLRLMTCYYLPGILGRGASVREDFAALGRLLPGVADHYPLKVYRGIVRFVLEQGNLEPEVRHALRTALPPPDG